MKTKYATAYMSYNDNDLTIEFVDAVSREDAMLQRLALEGVTFPDHFTREDADLIQEFAYDCDLNIDAQAV